MANSRLANSRLANSRLASVTLASLLLVPVCIAASCNPINNVELTFYGWHDNDPPSPDNASNCGRGNGPDGNPIAGGSGSFNDPISFATATDNSNFAKCAIVYVPSLRKYFRNEDDCTECKSDWDSSRKYHIDLWTGSNKVDGGDALVKCENNLPGGSNTIVNNAPDGLPVDLTPLYDGTTCYKTTYPLDNANSLCSGGRSGSENTTSTGNGAGSSTLAFQGGPSTTLLTSIAAPHSSRSKDGKATESTGRTCAWPGHCEGSSCQTENDCSDVLICGPQHTCVSP